MAKATSILQENMEILHRMSTLLIERETLDAEEIDMVIRGEELAPLEVKKMMQARMAGGAAERADRTPVIVGPNSGGPGEDLGQTGTPT